MSIRLYALYTSKFLVVLGTWTEEAGRVDGELMAAMRSSRLCV